MSKKYHLKYSKETIKVAAKPFASGGEGVLYKITAPAAYRNYVAKIYHPKKQTAVREKKTQYLIENPPDGLSESGSIVWIKDALYDVKYKFVGFIMPFVKGEKLEILCLGKLPKKMRNKWNRFDFRQPEAMKLRLLTCFNLAAAIYQMHSTNNYVLVDMKPDNIIIQPNGLLAIVDTDSVEVIEDGIAIYPAPVATPEYTPPEFYTKDYRKDSTVGSSWDRFGLAVIMYKLLFGIHPFTSSASAPFDNLVSLHEKIEVGLFVHSKSKQKHLKVIPPPHQRFAELDPKLQELFIQCFEDGHSSPEVRPTANEWCSALLMAIGDPKLQARYSHIMGLWDNNVGIKFKLPSRLYRDHDMAVNPMLWIEQKINGFFESPPSLPIMLHQLLKTGKQDIKLTLGPLDYISSWGLALAGVGLFGYYNPTFIDWFMGDFWLSATLWINLLLVAVFLFPQVILPRVISFARHLFSPQVQLRKVWNQFRYNYPQLQQEASKVKQDLFDNVLKQNKDQIKNFEKQKEGYVEPLTVYLKHKDNVVQELKEERKVNFEKLNQKYLNKASKNSLLAEMKGRSILDLEKRLDHFYKMKLAGIKKNIKSTDAYKSVYREFKVELGVLKKKDELVQEKLMEDAMIVFEPMKLFFDKFLKGTLAERKYLMDLFEEKRVDTLLDIEKVEMGTNGELYIYTYHKTPSQELRGLSWSKRFPIFKANYSKVNDLMKSLQKYAPMVLEAKQKDIEYGTEFFQLAYAPKKKEYQKKQAAVVAKMPNEKKVIQSLVQHQAVGLEESLKEARALLASLKASEEKNVELLKVHYEKKYQEIMENCEVEVNNTANTIKELGGNYKIAIEDLLATPKLQKIKISFDEKVEQVKEDIIKLEKMENR